MIRLRESIAKRLNRTQEVQHGTYTVREMAEQLLRLSDEQFGHYAFLHEPLTGKFSSDQIEDYIRKAEKCGQETAKRLAEDDCDMERIAESLHVKIREERTPAGGGHVIFAQFEEPDRITIFTDCLERLNRLVETENLDDLFSGVDFHNILLAHELFHAVEEAEKDSIYTQTEKIELWKKPFSNKSRILALSEIAAMAFAKTICGIPFSPYVLDVLMIVSYDRDAAAALYEEIMDAAGFPVSLSTPC